MTRTFSVDSPTFEGRRIGPYELVRELGSGGMGSVYLARRTDGVHLQPVAIKLLRPSHLSPILVHRFEQERRILASLDHPNIARLLDGGTTEDGLPYCVMELVDGVPINQYCDLHRLDVPSRLALFRNVCGAVEYAHRSGIVHRDVKPSNILVTAEGMVKLLDFGIAKLLGPDPTGTTLLTDSSLCAMTPEYASPEQVKGEAVTRATDVYSLGVVLYELLTGQRPYRLRKRVFHEIVRVLCEEEPTRPSVAACQAAEDAENGSLNSPEVVGKRRQTTPGGLQQQLQGDLDSILLKSLRKEPWQRYASAHEFARDIGQHLDGLPVDARSGRSYRLRKWLNRYRLGLTALTVLLLIMLTGNIHVTRSGVWILLGALVVLGLWQVTVDRELARRMAGWPVATVTTLTAIFLWLLGRPANAFPWPWWAELANSMLSGMARVIVGVLVFALFARWACRGRWSGGLVLDASSKPGAIVTAQFTALLVLGAGLLVISAFLAFSGGWDAGSLSFSEVTLELYIFVYIAFQFLLSPRLEFRQHGIVTAYAFHRWPQIESFGWEKNDTKDHVMLRIHVVGRHPFFQPVRVQVPNDKKPEMERVLTRFLSEWPKV